LNIESGGKRTNEVLDGACPVIRLHSQVRRVRHTATSHDGTSGQITALLPSQPPKLSGKLTYFLALHGNAPANAKEAM